MAISGTTTDYTGRQLDMYISGKLNPLSSADQAVTYCFGKPSKQVAGIQKLVQRYIISLVNSGFMATLIGSTTANISEAANNFNTYSWGVVQLFRAYQTKNPSTKLDEQINTVQLTDISSTGDTVSFSVLLTSLSGSTVTYTLPIPI